MLDILKKISKGSFQVDIDKDGYSYCFTYENDGAEITIGGFAYSLEEIVAAIEHQINQDSFIEYLKFMGLLGFE